MDSTTGATTSPASSAQPATAGRPSGRLPAGSLAGWTDVLDRVDGPAGSPRRRRLQAHRSAAPRGAGSRRTGFRAIATRGVPLRSVQPAPKARRPAPAPVVEPGSYWDMTRPHTPVAPVDSVRQPRLAPSRTAGLIRRAAMWGAGCDGEYLAWRTAVPRPAAARVPRGVALPAA